MRKLLLSMLVVGLIFGLAGCGEDDGNNPACLTDYGLVADGDACNENGNSRVECPAVSCTCSGSTTMTFYICFDSVCVTGIGNCDAWCAASDSDRSSCF